MAQYGFFFDQGRCYSCQACSIACKDWNSLQPGPEKWMTVYEWESGNFPLSRIHTLAFSCGHCEDPACVKACQSDAIFKEGKYGAVLVNQEKCVGCRSCYDACPYGAPKYADDSEGCKMSKCTMCIDRLEKGDKPQCVLSCPMRAFDFGLLDELIEKYGDVRQLDGMPDPGSVNPAFIAKAALPKRDLIPLDVNKVIELNAARGDLDPLPETIADLDLEGVADLVGRNSLSMKHETAEDLIRATRNDMG